MDLKSQYEAYEASKRERHIADKETAERLGIEIGSEYTTFPTPETKEEAFELLKKYKGLISLEMFIDIFKMSFPINLRTLRDELKTLADFIEEAEKISTTEAFVNRNISAKNKLHYEYLKLEYGHYENKQYNDYYDFFSSDTFFVYGKYFLYKKWIEEQIYSITSKTTNEEKSSVIEFVKPEPKLKLTFFERINRELTTIYWIFTSQSMSRSESLSFPLIHGDGIYCRLVNIASNKRLNRIEKYKKHYTNRYENGKRSTVVENELLEIYKKAIEIRDYYNKELTDKNPVVKNITESFKTDFSAEKTNRHTMTVIVNNYYVQDIIFHDHSMSEVHFDSWTKREFNYSVLIRELAEFCQKLIDFIDKFKISVIEKNEDDLNIDIVNVSEQPLHLSVNDDNNKLLIDAIEDHLPQEYFSDTESYEILKYALLEYFTKNKFPKSIGKINTVRMNKKTIGWGLSSIFREIKKSKPLSLEYVFFAKNIDRFENEIVENKTFQKSNLYKYMTEKPRK